MQKATLDPSKVSGRCGRLKCCLRFEHDFYVEARERFPRLGASLTVNGIESKVSKLDLKIRITMRCLSASATSR